MAKTAVRSRVIQDPPLAAFLFGSTAMSWVLARDARVAGVQVD